MLFRSEWQFLETMFGQVQCLVGVLLGGGITLGYTEYSNIIFSIPILQVLGAILLALLIGALSGVYPAIKASKIQPAEAVRK